MQHLCLFLDPSRTFRWHLWLAEALKALPESSLTIRFSSQRRPVPKSCLALFQAERVIYRMKKGSSVDLLDVTEMMRLSDTHSNPYDVLIDCAADDSTIPAARRVLIPSFNSVPAEIGAIVGLLSDARFRIDIYDTATPEQPWVGYSAIDHEIFARSLDNALSCAIGLVIKAINAEVHIPTAAYTRPPFVAAASVRAAVALHAGSVVARKASRLLTNMVLGGKKWFVAWRFDPTLTLLDRAVASFTVLPSRSQHYFADPFPFQYKGKDFIFLEDFWFKPQRGSISFSQIVNGHASVPEPVLDEPYHLSYPHIFEHGGDIWMIPESGQSHGIYLYRAERFPDRWSKEACIIDGIEGYDATLMRRGGRFWLFVCERICRSSSWDTLSLFYADNLLGPWNAVENNPVLFDVMCSRPAGGVFEKDGVQIRPVQDCSTQYGGAIQLYRVDKLGTRFEQTHLGTIHCGRRACHTYNRFGSLEVIDFSGRPGLKTVTAFYQQIPMVGRVTQSIRESSQRRVDTSVPSSSLSDVAL